MKKTGAAYSSGNYYFAFASQSFFSFGAFACGRAKRRI
jgi:hypothetical protein